MGKIMKNVIYTFLLLLPGLSTALLAYLHFFAPKDRDLSGEWTTQLAMTQQAAVTALDWLQEIEGVSVSLEEMESSMQGLTIEVSLSMEQTERMAGTFLCGIRADSYEACRQAAYEAFAESFRTLLGERLRMAGYAGSTDQEAVEALVAGEFGVSAVSYLMEYGPALLPSLEELQGQYEGSGVYEVDEGILRRRFEDGSTVITKEEYYIRKDDALILTGEADSEDGESSSSRYPVVYRWEPQQP